MRSNHQSGFIKLVLLIIVVILILSYFGVSLRGVANSQAGKDNFSFAREVALEIWDFCVGIWNNYLAEKLVYVWNEVIIKYGWNFALENLDKLRQ